MIIRINFFIQAGMSNSLAMRPRWRYRNKKSGLSISIQPDEDDIYNEIDLEDLRGPAVDNTIRLDVQDGEEDTNGDTENAAARGIVTGQSIEVCLKLLLAM